MIPADTGADWLGSLEGRALMAPDQGSTVRRRGSQDVCRIAESQFRRRRRKRTVAPPRTLSAARAGPIIIVPCLILSLLAAALSAARPDEAAASCTSLSPLIGFEADLSMYQKQLRGTIRIIDDCTFKVTRFDMLAGNEVFWWGARSEELADMLRGFKLSPRALSGTFNSQSFTVTLVNASWSDLKVLSVWSTATASDYGHVILETAEAARLRAESPGQAPAPAPAPAPALASAPTEESESGSDLEAESEAGTESGENEAHPGSGGRGRGRRAPPSRSLPSGVGGDGAEEEEEATKWGREQATMLENCLPLSHVLRLRWTLDEERGFVDLALEGAVGHAEYLALGWADPKAVDHFMIGADMMVAGLDANGVPFVEDYFATEYTECNFDDSKPSGVCPDSALGRNRTASSIELVHGQRMDGVTLIRFRRKLKGGENEFDHTINPTAETNIIWAHGPLRPRASGTKADKGAKASDLLVPAFHGTPQGSAYGISAVTLDNPVDDCQSVLRPPLPDLGPTVVADRGTSLLITSGPSKHFPNPPNPRRTLFINNHEAPVLKVERGVAVELSVQAGHDVAVYITTDPVGGLHDPNADIFAGGPDAHGVPAEPYKISWTPNSTTPDLVFYQAYSQAKMGWMVQVVDGGLSDMYSKSVLLAGSKQLTLFWTLTPTDISVAVRGERPSGYLAIAFGSAMVNAWSYVGWVKEDGTGNVSSYWMDSRDPEGVHPYEDNLTNWKCEAADGIITLEFQRPLKPLSCSPKCHVINPDMPVKVVWAYGNTWAAHGLTLSHMHTAWSSQATVVNLHSGESNVENLQPVFLVHGFMMFMAWGILIPFGMLAARYLKNRDWFKVHVYTQSSALSVMMLGLLFAVGELQGLDFETTHAKIGLATVLLGLWQPLNAYIRPPKAAPGERPSPMRIIWSWAHILSGRVAMLTAIAALLTGVYVLEEKGGEEASAGLPWAFVGWFATIGALVWFIERERKSDRGSNSSMVSLAHHQRSGRDSLSGLSRSEDLEDNPLDSDALLGPTRSDKGIPVESPSRPTLTELQKTASAAGHGDP